jgi:uncharacterized protein involved in copper resistance
MQIVAGGTQTTRIKTRRACGVCLFALASMPAFADDSQFGLTISKLEHLFEDSVNVFEIEGTYGQDDSFVAMKVETAHISDEYDASEAQIFYSRALGSSVSGIIGARYLHTDLDDERSAMFGLIAEGPLGINILMLALVGESFSEGRLEFERPFELSPRVELLPKFEVRAFSNEFEFIGFETRLAYATTERLDVYVGFVWERIVGTPGDVNYQTALAGISYEW